MKTAVPAHRCPDFRGAIDVFRSRFCFKMPRNFSSARPGCDRVGRGDWPCQNRCVKHLWRFSHAEFAVSMARAAGRARSGRLRGVIIGTVLSLPTLAPPAPSRPRTTELGRVPGTDDFADRIRHAKNQREPGCSRSASKERCSISTLITFGIDSLNSSSGREEESSRSSILGWFPPLIWRDRIIGGHSRLPGGTGYQIQPGIGPWPDSRVLLADQILKRAAAVFRRTRRFLARGRRNGASKA